MRPDIILPGEFYSPLTVVTSSALSNHVLSASKQTASIEPEWSRGSEFSRDNRESETVTANFPKTRRDRRATLYPLSLFPSVPIFVTQAFPPPSPFNGLAFISWHGCGRIRNHSGKAILNFLPVSSRGDKIPRTGRVITGLSKRGVDERERVTKGEAKFLERGGLPVNGYMQTRWPPLSDQTRKYSFQR